MLKMKKGTKVVSIKDIKIGEGNKLVLYTSSTDRRKGRLEINVKGQLTQENLERGVDRVYNNLIRAREWGNLKQPNDQYCSNLIHYELLKHYPTVDGLLHQLTMQMNVGIEDSEIEKVENRVADLDEERLFNLGGAYVSGVDGTLISALWGVTTRNRFEGEHFNGNYIPNGVEFSTNPFGKTSKVYRAKLTVTDKSQETKEFVDMIANIINTEILKLYKVSDKRKIGVVHLGHVVGIMKKVGEHYKLKLTTEIKDRNNE